MYQEFWHVREPVYERPLLLSLRREAPHALLEPLGDVKITVGTNREAGRGLELAVDDGMRLELAARRFRRNGEGKDAAGAGGPNVEGVTVQDQVYRFRQLLPY